MTFLDSYNKKLFVKTNTMYDFLSVFDDVLFSVIDKRKHISTDYMSFLDKAFGKRVTTRNWNTVQRIIKVFEENY